MIAGFSLFRLRLVSVEALPLAQLLDVMGRAARGRLCHQVQSHIALRQLVDLCLRNADQDDGFGMLYRPYPDDLPILVDRDHRMDGFAGVRRCLKKIDGDEDPANRLAILGIGATVVSARAGPPDRREARTRWAPGPML